MCKYVQKKDVHWCWEGETFHINESQQFVQEFCDKFYEWPILARLHYKIIWPSTYFTLHRNKNSSKAVYFTKKKTKSCDKYLSTSSA